MAELVAAFRRAPQYGCAQPRPAAAEFNEQHIQNLVGCYRDQQKWQAGPLGDYFFDDCPSGRGAAVVHSVAALATLCGCLGLAPDTLRLPNENRLPTHKGCPGKTVSEAAIVARVTERLSQHHGVEHARAAVNPDRPAIAPAP